MASRSRVAGYIVLDREPCVYEGDGFREYTHFLLDSKGGRANYGYAKVRVYADKGIQNHLTDFGIWSKHKGHNYGEKGLRAVRSKYGPCLIAPETEEQAEYCVKFGRKVSGYEGPPFVCGTARGVYEI